MTAGIPNVEDSCIPELELPTIAQIFLYTLTNSSVDRLGYQRKPEFFISSNELETWTYLKGAKKEKRTTKSGYEYKYSEGPVTFPDALNRASRTIITGEGGRGASRFKHVIETKSGKHRRLTPIELERLNQFKDNHTAGQSDNKRAFFMGNALVVGVVEKLGRSLISNLT